MINVLKFLLVFMTALKLVACKGGKFNGELMGQSALYGISYLAQGDEDKLNSSICYRHLKEMFDGLQNGHLWALKSLDVSGRPGPGFIFGNNLWLGSHLECVQISNRKKFEINYNNVKHANETPFDYPPYPLGFYVAHLEHNNTLQFHTQMPSEFLIQLGLCMPRSCSFDELGSLLQKYFDGKYLATQKMFDINMKLTRIRLLEDDSSFVLYDPKLISALCVITALLILSIIGTCYDVKKHNLAKNLMRNHHGNLQIGKQNIGNVSEVDLVSTSSTDSTNSVSTFGEIIKCFSIYTNTKKLVETSLPANSVKVVHGLKFFAMLYVILVHSIYYQNDYITNNSLAFRLSEDFSSQIISNSTYCVDTFLCISGFLVGYLFFKAKKSQSANYARKFIEFIMMFFNRFLRLTPTYMIVMFLTSAIYRYYRQTATLFSSEDNDALCAQYWWRNLLYINNLYPRKEMCMSWSWYLSLDTQCFLIVTFLLILSTMHFKLAAAAMLALMPLNIITTAYKSYVVGYIPTMDEQYRHLDTIYDLPWQRIGAYVSGVITAYILVVKLDGKLELTKRAKFLLWTIFPLLNLWIIFTIYTRNISVEFSAFYMGTSRTLWGVGIGWILLACCTGNARALEKFLSFKGWIMFSRLTYCAYLLNPLVANVMYLSQDSPFYASLSSFSIHAEAVTFTTYLMAYFFSVLIESPSILLTKMLFDKITKKAKAQNSVGQV